MRRERTSRPQTGGAAGALLLVGVLALSPVADARADSGAAAAVSGAVGFMLGTIVGGAMTGGQGDEPPPPSGQRAPRPAVKKPKPVARTPDKTVVNIQTALKAFGLYEGAVDGQSGPGTRRAIGLYQDALGEPVTGTLTAAQYDRLMQLYANRGNGAALAARRDQDTDQLFAAISRGTATPAAAATTVGMATVGAAGTAAAGAGAAGGVSAAAPASEPDPGKDYSDICLGRVAVQKPDAQPHEALLRAHFCATHARALAAGQAAMVAANVTDMSDVRAQCTGAAEGVAAILDAVAAAEPAAQIARVRAELGATPADMQETVARSFVVCIGQGLASGAPEIVDAAAVALATLGQEAYLELPAGAQALGIGGPPEPEAAAGWYAFLASRSLTPAGGEGPAILAEDLEAFSIIAAGLKAGSGVQVARTEGFRVPSFGRASAPAPASPAVVAAPVPGPAVAAPPLPVAPGPGRTVLSNAAIAETLREAIVQIYDPKEGSSGTGFVIAPGYILTNSHVVEGADRVVVASRRYGVRAARVVARGLTSTQVGIDAAVLETVNWTADRVLAFHPTVREGERVAIGGFPGRASAFDRSSERFFEIIAANRIPSTDDIPLPKFDFGYVQSIIVNNETGLRNIQEGLETSPGNSGSPITNECGDVVGLHYQGSVAKLKVSGGAAYGDTSKYNYAITSDEVMKFLRALNIPYQVAAAGCS